jgi:hypothetical protein
LISDERKEGDLLSVLLYFLLKRYLILTFNLAIKFYFATCLQSMRKKGRKGALENGA